jgi:hypothetical protein
MGNDLPAVIAGGFYVVVGGLDVGRLGVEKLPHGEREFSVESVFVGFFGCVLALLRGFEEGVIAAAQAVFQAGPGAMDGSAGCATFLDVVDAFQMEDGFEFAAELGAFEGLGEKVALVGFVFEFVADLLEAFLAVDQALDYIAEGLFYFFQCGGCVGHKFLSVV